MDSLVILFLLCTNPSIESYLSHFDVDSLHSLLSQDLEVKNYVPNQVLQVVGATIVIEEETYLGELFLSKGKGGKSGKISFSSSDSNLYKVLSESLSRTARSIQEEANVFIPANERRTYYGFGGLKEHNGMEFSQSASLGMIPSTGERRVRLSVTCFK